MPATFVFQPADTDLAQNGSPQFIGIKRFHCKILLFVAHRPASASALAPAPARAQERDWGPGQGPTFDSRQGAETCQPSFIKIEKRIQNPEGRMPHAACRTPNPEPWEGQKMYAM